MPFTLNYIFSYSKKKRYNKIYDTNLIYKYKTFIKLFDTICIKLVQILSYQESLCRGLEMDYPGDFSNEVLIWTPYFTQAT